MSHEHDVLGRGPAGAFILDTRLDQESFGTFEFVSPVFSELLGWPSSVIVGKPLWQFAPSEDRAALEEWLRQRAAARDWPPEIATALEHRSGNTKQVVIHFRGDDRETDGADRPLRVFAVALPTGLAKGAFDLLEAKNHEVAALKLEIEHTQDRVNRLLAMLGHDLRNTMTAILGLSQGLESRLLALRDGPAAADGERERAREFDTTVHQIPTRYTASRHDVDQWIDMAYHVKKSAEAANLLLDNILTHKAISSGKRVVVPVWVNLREIVDEVYRLDQERFAYKDLTLEITVADDLELEFDPSGIRQLLTNLLTNARKFSHSGATVTISAEVVDGAAVIEVVDEGVGIAAEKISSLFDLNAATSTPGTIGERGTGFGLPICHEILAAHGGVLLVSSERGVGSTFTARFPQPPVVVRPDSKPSSMAVSMSPQPGAAKRSMPSDRDGTSPK